MLLNQNDNLLLYGLTGSGKTSQLAELIKAEYAESNKPALCYLTDWGGKAPLVALANAGKAELEIYNFTSDPFVFIDAAVQGKRFVGGKWVTDDLAKYCLSSNESLSGMGDLALNALGRQAANGFGGDAQKAPALTIQSEGQVIKVASNSPTHYGMAQRHLLEKVWQSQLLPLPVVWTAHEDVGDADSIGAQVGVKGIIGPMIAGHALTTGLPKYFVYTFRLAVSVTAAGKQHILYTERHKDGLYEALANNRAPLGTKIVVPGKVQPANLVQVLQRIQEAKAEEKAGLKR